MSMIEAIRIYNKRQRVGVKEALGEAVAHYGRMLQWALEENPEDIRHQDAMEHAIGETWYADYCPCCQLFMDAETDTMCCWDCPLNALNVNDVQAVVPITGAENCCGGLWVAMNKARTWEQWIEGASKVRDFIIDRQREHDAKI